jgi:gliding motility-associated-like protein
MKQNYIVILLVLITQFTFALPNVEVPPPSAAISGGATVCQNAAGPVITFTGSGGTSPYTFTYSINGVLQPTVTTTGNNNSVTINAPTNVTGVFNYNLTLVQDISSSQILNLNTVVTVISNFTVNASSDILVCRGNQISLSCSVSGNGSNPVTYSWSGPNGFTSNQQSPTIPNSTTAMTGSYTVTASIGNCQTQDVVNVTVAEPQIESLGGTTITSFIRCNVASSNFTFNLSNQSYQSNILNYFISWGDNTSGTFTPSSNPISHSYPIGSYTISIQMNLTNGCSVTKTYPVFVGSSPSPATMALFVNQATGCVPHTTQYTFNVPSTNVDGTTYVVSWGDGTPDETYVHPVSITTLTHTYNVSSCGNNVVLNNVTYYNVFQPTVVTQNPCSTPQPSGSGLISVGQGPIASFTPSNNNSSPIKVCMSQALQLSNTSNFGLTIPAAGATCSSVSPFYWTISPSTAGLWTATGLGSNNGDVNDTDNWTVGSTTPSINFNSPGNYTITLRVKNSCGESSYSQTFCVEPPLVPQFTLNTNSGCIPLAVTTTNSTNLNNQCSAPTYLWEVAHAPLYCSTSTVTIPNQTTPNATFNFTESGTYTIKLSVTNSCGTTSTTQTVTVKKPPTVTLNAISNACGTANITPVGSVTNCAPTGGALTYAWNFPGGTPATSNVLNPGTISYPTGGPYTVSFTATNECGISNTANQSFTVSIAPVITNTVTSQTVCSGAQTTPVNLTANPNGTTFAWSATATAGITGFTAFGNGAVIPAQTITTTNTNPGTVTYVVTPTFNGCVGTPFNYVINVNPAPSITTQPASSSVCLGGTATAMTVSLNSSAVTPTYQWYSNTTNSNTGGTLIPGATNSTYTPPTNTVGTIYYYCVISLSSGGCSGLTSAVAAITVSPLPTITTQPLPSQSICVGATVNAFSVAYTGGLGTASYQWFSNSTNSNTGGTAVGTNSATYTPPTFNTPGNYYYYVVISLSGNGCGTVTSAVAEVIVLPDPVITIQPLSTQTQCQNTPATVLTVSASGGTGNFSYQWYSSSTNSNASGTLIPGATNNTFTPPTGTIGTLYYFCIVTQTGLGCTVTSATAAVITVAAPSISTQPLQTQTVCLNGTTTSLSVNYINGIGTPTYQWYSNSLNSNTGGVLIPGATNANFTPPSTSVGTLYYYCVVTFTSGGCTSTTSNTSAVIVNDLPTISNQPLPSQSICVGATINPLSVSFAGGVGTPSYQWFSNTTNSNTGGTPIAGATSSTYTPPIFTTVGTYYYYVVVTLNGNGCGTINTNTAEVIVVADPTITAQPLATQTQCQNTPATTLTVTATGGIGVFSYQWFSNSTNSNSNGVLLPAQIGNTFVPPTTAIGTTYYYCVVSQSGVGCSVTSATAAVTVVPAPAITTQPQTVTVCEGSTLSPLTVAYTNGTGTATYQWFDSTGPIAGATTATYTPSNTTSNTYYCVITFSSGGCTSVTSDSAIVTINPLPTIDNQPLSTQSICVGGAISALTVSYTGGVGTPTYQWYSNTNNTTSGGTAVGTNSPSYTPPTFTTTGIFYYYVTISLNGAGCGIVTSNVAQVIVVPDPVLTTQPLAQQTVCQNTPATVLEVQANGGIGSTYAYQWYVATTNNTTSGTLITSQTNSTFTPPTNVAGTFYYYCVVTQNSGDGCNVTSAVATVTVNLAPDFTSQPLSSNICLGQTPTVLSFVIVNGVGTPTYQWYSNTTNTTTGGVIISGATSATYAPPSNVPGTIYYYCVVTFPSITGGCSVITTNTAAVIINPNPEIAAEAVTICSGTSFSITPAVSGGNIIPLGTTYTWSAPLITPTGSVTGASAEVTPQTTISQNLVNTTTSPATVTYTVTPVSGVCVGVPFTVTVTVNPAINPNVVVNNNACFGVNTASITTNITGGIPFSTGTPYQLNWTGPNGFTSNSTSISNISPGVYQVTIADAGGCPFSNSYTISEPTDIVITVDSENDVTCFNAANGSINLTVTGGTGNYTYNWTQDGSFYAATQDIANLSPGTYVVTVTDANNCGPKIATFTITQPPLLVVSLTSQTNVLCFGAATGAINVSVSGGTPNPTTSDYTYSWVGPNGFTSNNQNLTSLFAGVYDLAVTDNLGCVKNLSVTITQSTAIVISYTTTPITCYGANNASLSATITGGNGPYQYQWNNLATSLNQTNLSAGTYVITVTDNVGCIQTQSIVIPEAPIFTINPIVNNVSCYGANNGSINLNLTGGIAPVALTWSDGSTSGLIRNNLPPGTYTATISDGTPCYIVRTFTIIQPQPLVLSANTTNPLDCTITNNGTIDLIVSGGTPPFTYSWSNGATTEDLNSLVSGNYGVTVTDANNCVATAQYTLIRPAPIQINVTTETDYDCGAHEVTQQFVAQASGGVPPYQYQWSSGNVSGVNGEIMSSDINGAIILTVTDGVGCTATYTVDVDNPVIGYSSFDITSFGYSTYGIYSIGDPIQFESDITGDYVSVSWDFGDGTFSSELSPTHTYLIPRDYVVTQTVTYPFGCVYVQTITLVVEKGYMLVVPTAFTPNNDSLNDTYRPVSKRLKNIRLDIYDTWGSLVYTETGDVLVGWDGKIKGFNAENGNYYSKVTAETFYGTIVNENQTFVLIK